MVGADHVRSFVERTPTDDRFYLQLAFDVTDAERGS